MATTTIQPDATAGLDTFITVRAASSNYGTGIGLIVGELNDDVGSSGDRSLIKFDLSNIPSTATITSAILSLYATEDHSSNASTFRVYRQKRAWVETQATWNVYATGTNWQTAGAFGANDCEQTEIGNRAFTATETLSVFKDFTLTAAKVQEWVSGVFANNGMLISPDAGSDNGYYFASSDSATSSNKPKFVIVWVDVKSILGTSSGSGTATGLAKATGRLVANVSGTSTVTGVLKARGRLVAVVSATSTATGILKAGGRLVGTVSGTATVNVVIKANGYLVGAGAGTATVTSTLRATAEIAGTLSGSSAATGTLRASGLVRASVTGTSTATALAKASGYLEGSISGSSEAIARPTGDISLDGAITGTSTVTGSLHGKISIAGLSSASSSATGTLTAKGLLDGMSLGTATVVGAILALGRLSGTIAGSSIVTGRLNAPVGQVAEALFKGMEIGLFKGMR